MVTNQQETLSLSSFIVTYGVYPPRDGNYASSDYLASIHTVAWASAGFDILSGQTLTINSNPALFSLLGTNFGGDGRSTFSLPNINGKVLIGTGQQNGAVFTNGQNIGQNNIIINKINLPINQGGQGLPIDNHQESLAINYIINTGGHFPARGDGYADANILGAVQATAGSYVPAGFMSCAGQLLPISQYQALYAVIGTTFGGDGRTNFALPDLRGKSIVGSDYSSGIRFGSELGTDSINLTNSNLPVTGAGSPINNVQPSLALNYFITSNGLYPSRGRPLGTEDNPYVGEIIAFAGNYTPQGWIPCDGRLLSLSDNTALFSLIGTTFGGDGRTNFAVPDLRHKAILGTSSYQQVGQENGTNLVSLSLSDLPPNAGVVHDGYLANAIVWVDSNENGLRDWTDDNSNGIWDLGEGEAWTVTDKNGAFDGLTGIGTLRVGPNPNGRTVDISTGLEFTEGFSAPSGSSVINPLTTLLTAEGIDLETILTKLGLGSGIDLLNHDPIAAIQSNDISASTLGEHLLNLEIAHLISLVQDLAHAAHGSTLSSHAVAKAVVNSIATAIQTAEDTTVNFSDASFIKDVLSNSLINLLSEENELSSTEAVSEFVSAATSAVHSAMNELVNSTSEGDGSVLLQKLADYQEIICDILSKQSIEAILSSDLAQFTVTSETLGSLIKFTSDQDLDNRSYVKQLYHDVLLRDADHSGADYWLGQLNNGVLDREQLLVEFATSVESLTYTPSHLTDGYFFS